MSRLPIISFIPTFLLLSLTGCGGGGGGSNEPPPPPPPVTVNLLNTWGVTFTPDQCVVNVHNGLATFPSNQGNVAQLGNSRIEMLTLGCPGQFFNNITATLDVVGYPSAVTEILFLEMLTEHFSHQGKYTIRTFSSNRIEFHRDVSETDPTSVNNGVFNLTR